MVCWFRTAVNRPAKPDGDTAKLDGDTATPRRCELMLLSDVSVKRPVAAIVLSLLLVVFVCIRSTSLLFIEMPRY
ncbi:hypothetical protein O9929_05460 [Vibrio lentus]|nr:hypothetical protein [Vibrio lentus]